MSAILFQLQSFAIICLLVFGISQHRNRLKHKQIMWSAVIWDLILIVQIELNREAVEKALTTQDNTPILNIHVCLALITVVLYFVAIYLGQSVLKGKNHLLKFHKNLGKLVLLLRVMTFITSFFVKTI
jgi:uncharacterized membrane protein YozB (DUF420 family)